MVSLLDFDKSSGTTEVFVHNGYVIARIIFSSLAKLTHHNSHALNSSLLSLFHEFLPYPVPPELLFGLEVVRIDACRISVLHLLTVVHLIDVL